MVKKEVKKSTHKVKDSTSPSFKCEKYFRPIVILLLLISITLSILVLNKVQPIQDKVSRIDLFFSKSVPGYDDLNVNDENPDKTINSNKVDLSNLNDPIEGNKDAKVTIIEYSDYECPFCERFYSNTYKQLKAEYIDTGKVNLIFKDFPLNFHKYAKPAAIAANCVREQLGDEKYFEMHNKIYENQDSLSSENLKKWAISLGVDENKFDTCLTSSEISNEISQDIAEGQKAGISGTPSFIINGDLIVGAQPYSVFKEKIDSLLNN